MEINVGYLKIKGKWNRDPKDFAMSDVRWDGNPDNYREASQQLGEWTIA